MNGFVALVGRPNVGKSTLFNSLIGEKKSITHTQTGTTLDLIFGEVTIKNRAIQLADGPGVFEHFDDVLNNQAQQNAINVFANAALLIFVIDSTLPMTKEDRTILQWLRKQSVPFIVAATKADARDSNDNIEAAERVIGKEIIPVAALQGQGLHELQIAISNNTSNIDDTLPLNDESKPIKVALLGRPNVGKSSLFNLLAGESLSLISEIPGTTRDPVDTLREYPEEQLVVQWIDTAGLRRRNKINDNLEYITYLKSHKVIEACDIAVLLLSSEVDIVRQDETIIQHILEQKKALILVLSKIDLLNDQELKKWQKDARAWLPYIKWAPIVSLSVKKKKGIDVLLHQIKKANHEYRKKLSTQDINHFIEHFQNGQVSPIVKGKRAKMYYGVQTDTNPPTFTIFTNNADLFRFSYVRALENNFREYFGFQGSPIVFNYKSKSESSPNPFAHKTRR